jgi:hypothetical protein
MNATDRVIAALREHVRVCEEVLRIEEAENAMLNSPGGKADFCAERQAILTRLNGSIAGLKGLRGVGKDPNVSALLRAAQELIMKTIALGRENERTRLVHGLMPPRHLPSHHQERPHFVAEVYRRNGG